ncbi:MAG: Na/Pi cotransporter family protein [Alphaproteobacteria bacterium]
MSGFQTLLSIAGAVALLLWATRMVRTGVDRAHGAALRRFLRGAASTRLGAAAAGCLLAIGLQGSTAVALLVTGTVASGITTAAVGLAVVLGADLGSALVVQILSFDLSALVPILILVGVTTFLTANRRSVRQAGRIIIGIALILVALRMIGQASLPLRESGMLPLWTEHLAGDPMTAFLMAAIVTWLMHSGVASVLLIISLSAHGLLPLPLALTLVLGANFGSGIIAAVLSRNHDREARIVPYGNLVIRLVFSVAAVVAMQFADVPALFATLLPALAPEQTVALFHIGFNSALLILGLPISSLVVAMIGRLMVATSTDEPELPELSRQTSLDPDMVAHPRQAIANTIREILSMSDTVSVMLSGIVDAFENGNRERIHQLTQLDDEVDSQYTRIKLYLAEVGRQKLSKSESRRCVELMTFCIKLEQVGDIIVRNLLSLADKKRTKKVGFSRPGWGELLDLHERVSANLQLSLNVLVSGDRESARELLEEKESVRELEHISTSGHMERLQSGTVASIESSEIHLDAVRAFIQINALLASVAYPILEESGELLDSRLAPAE